MLRIGFAVFFMLSLAPVQGAVVTLKFEGTIDSVVDANTPGLPDVDFTPIPVGSQFVGQLSYDTTSPIDGGGMGYLRYLNMLGSSATVTVNGHTFSADGETSASVVSQEAGFGYSGIGLSTQPISLPEGWSVSNVNVPSFLIQLEDVPIQTRPLTLPATAEEFPVGNQLFFLDLKQPVTIEGQTYGDRVMARGHLTSLQVVLPPPPPRLVTIDVDPTSTTNKINLTARKPKPLDVVVFGESDFNVLNVDADSIVLGDPLLTDVESGTGMKVPPATVTYQDVNRDGQMDLLLRFDLLMLIEFGAINSRSTELEFLAFLQNRGVVFGSDKVSTSGSKGPGK